MLRIVVEGMDLDLADDISIALTLSSPLFLNSDNSLKGSYCYNFQVPTTDKNKQIFNYPHRPVRKTTFAPISTQDCKVYFDGRQIIDGVIQMSLMSEKIYECNIGVAQGAFSSLISGKTLQDLNHDMIDLISLINPTSLNDIAVWFSENIVPNKYPKVPFALFPVHNDKYWKGSTLEAQYTAKGIYQNYWHYIFGENAPRFLERWQASSEDAWTYNIFTPFPYVGYVINKIFNTYNYLVKNNPFAQDAELSKLVIFNTFSEGWENTGPNIPDKTNNIYLRNHVPAEDIQTFLLKLQNLGFRYIFNNNDRTLQIKFLKDILLSTNIKDWTQKAEPNPIGMFFPIPANYGWDFTMPIPAEDTLSTTLTKNQYGLLLGSVDIFEDLPLTGNNINDIYAVTNEGNNYIWTQPDDITLSPKWVLWNGILYRQNVDTFQTLINAYGETIDIIAGDIYLVLDEQNYYKCLTVGSWDRTDPMNPVWILPTFEVVGSNIVLEEEINGKSNTSELYSTLPEYSGVDELDVITGKLTYGTPPVDYYKDGSRDQVIDPLHSRIWTVPLLEQPGKDYFDPALKNNSFIPRLLFYLGLQNDHDIAEWPEIDLPYGNHQYPRGSFRGDTFALSLNDVQGDGAKAGKIIPGIYNSKWADWVNWFLYKTKQFKIQRTFSGQELADVDFSQKYRIQNYNFLVKEIRVNLRKYYIEKGEMDVYTV